MRSLPLRVLTLIVACLIFASSLGAGIGGQFVTEDNPPRPAKNVALELWPESVTARKWVAAMGTDMDGRFSFTDIAPGPYRIKVAEFNRAFQPDGALSGFYFPREGQVVELTANKILDVRMVAKFAALAVGRVLDDEGKHLDVLILSTSSNCPLVREDETGRFRAPGLEPGKDAEILLTPIDRKYMYARFVVLKGADVKPGMKINVGEFHWKPLSGTPNVKGTVRDPTGKLLPGLSRFELQNVNESVAIQLHPKDGLFELEVPPGTYRIVELHVLHVPVKELARIDVPVKGMVTIDFTFDPIADRAAPTTRPVSPQ